MYQIHEESDREKYTLLIPAMLDMHFPLLKYAFYSKNYHPVILENEEDITNIGLKYVNNDMCYPCILNIGQMIGALQSGKYDLSRTRLLMPSAGDACRGSNYTVILRKALKRAGLEQVKVVSLNLKGIEKDQQLNITFSMVWRALFGLYYCDLLMLLLQQVRPNEKNPGEAEAMWKKWIQKLSVDFKTGKHLTFHSMKANFRKIAADFASIELQKTRKKRVGIVGELYIKYCHIGNWNMIRFLEEQGCESHTNGLTWYVLYYIDSHLSDSKKIESLLYKIGLWFLGGLQNTMIQTMKDYGFYTLEKFSTFKKDAAPYVDFNLSVGDGWLMGAEIAEHIRHGCPRVLAIQPFGCMANHVCGRGLYSALSRKLPQGCLVSADVDSSGSKVNVYNRARMLIDWENLEF